MLNLVLLRHGQSRRMIKGSVEKLCAPALRDVTKQELR
jgi:hypothetical protein